MADKTGIAWCDYTYNRWIGCLKISDGCKNCYAPTDRARYGHTGEWGPPATSLRTLTSPAYWRKPLTWNKKAEAEGVRRRVFCASLADVFEDVGEAHPQVIAARAGLWPLIEQTPHLDWLLLTKRPENIPAMVPQRWMEDGFPDHVWMGTSVEHQAAAEERIPLLLKIPARIRWLSCEPLLGPLDLLPWLTVEQYTEKRSGPPFLGIWGEDKPEYHYVARFRKAISWVIVGGESGHHYRSMKAEWALSLRDQCQERDIPFFFKQWAGRTSGAGGHLLDGQEYHEWPEGVSYASAK